MGIYKFTSATGRIAWGVVTELQENGAYVLFDDFAPRDKVLIKAHYAYVSFEPNPFVEVVTKREVLPVTTPVQWKNAQVREVVQRLGDGFGAWWARFGPDIRKGMYHSF